MDLFKQPEVIVFVVGMLIAMFSTIIGCVIWFVRLESTVKGMKELSALRLESLKHEHQVLHGRIDTVKSEHGNAMRTLIMEVNEVKVQLAELIGYLKKQKSP